MHIKIANARVIEQPSAQKRYWNMGIHEQWKIEVEKCRTSSDLFKAKMNPRKQHMKEKATRTHEKPTDRIHSTQTDITFLECIGLVVAKVEQLCCQQPCW